MTRGIGFCGGAGGAAALVFAATLGAGVVRAQNPTQDRAAPTQEQAQVPTPSPASPARPVAGAHRGTIVCEQAPGSADILHVPLDIAVRGSAVQFARPLFDPGGTRVLGSELGG